MKTVKKIALALALLLAACAYGDSTPGSIDLPTPPSPSPPESSPSVELSPSSYDGTEVITFPDPNFEAAVREIIGNPEGEITWESVRFHARLDVSGRGISDLTG
ncbi:MAG: hypothetical protein LBI19_03595 [Oscillospiraceae bacterium]|jgi:hypothetical protein|nr:hypothetical protein [Oscillospiraceae bacterium]